MVHSKIIFYLRQDVRNYSRIQVPWTSKWCWSLVRNPYEPMIAQHKHMAHTSGPLEQGIRAHTEPLESWRHQPESWGTSPRSEPPQAQRRRKASMNRCPRQSAWFQDPMYRGIQTSCVVGSWCLFFWGGPTKASYSHVPTVCRLLQNSLVFCL